MNSKLQLRNIASYMYNDFNRKEIERQREEMVESYANKKAEMLEKTEQVRYTSSNLFLNMYM